MSLPARVTQDALLHVLSTSLSISLGLLDDARVSSPKTTLSGCPQRGRGIRFRPRRGKHWGTDPLLPGKQ